MTPSALVTLFAALCCNLVVIAIALLQLPRLSRRTECAIRAWVSPLMLVTYVMMVVAAFLSAMSL